MVYTYTMTLGSMHVRKGALGISGSGFQVDVAAELWVQFRSLESSENREGGSVVENSCGMVFEAQGSNMKVTAHQQQHETF